MTNARFAPGEIPAPTTARIAQALRANDMSALVCALPTNVLMVTGYWPVVGTALAVVSASGGLVVLAPEDEKDLADQRWGARGRDGGGGDLVTFRTGSLHELFSVSEAIAQPLADALRRLGVEDGRIGYEADVASEPASYVAMNIYGAALPGMLRAAAPAASLADAGALLVQLRSVLPDVAIECVRTACRVAARAFAVGSQQLRTGITEVDAATGFRAPLGTCAVGRDGIARAGGSTHCMSGPNAALAYGAYARSRGRQIAPGDLVLTHCNSYVDGYWTDITRTYCMGRADVKQRRMYNAVFAARAAAHATIRPGVRAAGVDHSARRTLAEHGFGDEYFRHSTGHGVGLAAIDHTARPRLHPKSDDVLEEGMVFNVEPAIYVDGYGGIRHCDVVTVTAHGMELLTPFQASVEELEL